MYFCKYLKVAKPIQQRTKILRLRNIRFFQGVEQFDFLSHSSVVVLLVIDRTQSWPFWQPARMSTHREIISARCLSRLLEARKRRFFGRYHFHMPSLCCYTLPVLPGMSLTCRCELVSWMQCCSGWFHCLRFLGKLGTSIGLSGICTLSLRNVCSWRLSVSPSVNSWSDRQRV